MVTDRIKKTVEGRPRSSDNRIVKTTTRPALDAHGDVPAAGAHAAHHLINEDATPGAGVLPSRAHRSGKEVDGAAG